VIARNCDWFIALPAPVVIVGVIALVLVFQQSFENRSIGASEKLLVIFKCFDVV